MSEIELIGVPFDGYGRAGHQAAAAAALREAGLPGAFASHRITHDEDLTLPEPDPRRGPSTSLVNEPALLAMVDSLGTRASRAVELGRFPVVHGGDCTTLLGTIPALRSSAPIGLLFVDGHEDTMPLDVSEDGEAANTEIGLLLGLTGRLLSGPLADRLPALGRDELAVLGPRDERWRRQFNVGTLRDTGVWFRDWRQTAADPARAARAAVGHLQEAAGRWWLHVDLDVLDPEHFAAQGVPGGVDEPHGLTWEALTTLLTTAVGEGGCVGWSIAIYDPDQDPSRSDAARIVRLVADVAASLAGDGRTALQESVGAAADHPRLLHTVVDTTDVRAAAEFYRELLGLDYRPGDERPADDTVDDADWLVLRDRNGVNTLAFQHVDRLEPTTWPSPDVPMQLHLDFTVASAAELERHRRRAESLGARLLVDDSADPDEPLYVFADPDGHPFCLFVAS